MGNKDSTPNAISQPVSEKGVESNAKCASEVRQQGPKEKGPKNNCIKWGKNKITVTPTLREKLICMDNDSMWLSVAQKLYYNKSENGMIHYNHKMDKIIDVIEYPQNIEPQDHCVCVYQNRIYLVDPWNETIISFDTKSQSFSIKTSIPYLGSHPNGICVFNKIHIFNGHQNTSHYLVYDPSTNKVIDHEVHTSKINGSVAFFMQDRNRIIRIGGYDYDAKEVLDTCSVSSIIEEHQADNIPEFEINYKWRLPIPLFAFAAVLYKHYIFIFGGMTSNEKYVDCIYLLDTNNDDQGWRKLSHIKCPIPGSYIATLSKDESTVHLFTTSNKWPDWQESQRGNYYLPISKVIGPEYLEFDFSILQAVDTTTMDIVNGYIRSEKKEIIDYRIMPQVIIDICVIYYFFLSYL